MFKHSEPRRAPCRHDPPLTPLRPQPKPPPHNARQRNNGHPRAQPPRHSDITIQRNVDMPTPLADIKAHNGADNRPAACSLRSATTPSKDGRGFRGVIALALRSAKTPHRHKLPTLVRAFSLRSGVPCHGFAHPLRAAAALSAAHLRATHSPDDIRLDITNDTRTYDIATYRHNDTSTQAPPHTPSAARRHTTPLRLPWRSLMQGRAVIPHQSKIFIRPTTHCFTEALMAELFGWAALLRHSSSPRCPGHLRYAHRRHRHACHDITPTCFRDM